MQAAQMLHAEETVALSWGRLNKAANEAGCVHCGAHQGLVYIRAQYRRHGNHFRETTGAYVYCPKCGHKSPAPKLEDA